MLLLISPINHEEAIESIEGGADIVDVKNPKEGSLGANFPWVIKDILGNQRHKGTYPRRQTCKRDCW